MPSEEEIARAAKQAGLVDQLANENAELIVRVGQLERRVAELEARGTGTGAKPAKPAKPQPQGSL